ncbi:hypothetical protein Q7L59_23755, partial [Pseudomonas protegens]|nr:hypothetical protein [Pseudomonas protegens]
YRYAPNALGWVDPWGLCASKSTSNWKSVKKYGHTFNEHGAGAKNTKRLMDRARGTNNNQGQWLNNEQAADLLSKVNVTKPTKISIPEGLGQVIKPDGSIAQAKHAIVVPRGNEIRTSYPVLE